MNRITSMAREIPSWASLPFKTFSSISSFLIEIFLRAFKNADPRSKPLSERNIDVVQNEGKENPQANQALLGKFLAQNDSLEQSHNSTSLNDSDELGLSDDESEDIEIMSEQKLNAIISNTDLGLFKLSSKGLSLYQF